MKATFLRENLYGDLQIEKPTYNEWKMICGVNQLHYQLQLIDRCNWSYTYLPEEARLSSRQPFIIHSRLPTHCIYRYIFIPTFDDKPSVTLPKWEEEEGIIVSALGANEHFRVRISSTCQFHSQPSKRGDNCRCCRVQLYALSALLLLQLYIRERS